MDLSQQSIKGQEFDLNRRGYDPDAVDAHLSEIAAAVDAQTRRIAEMETTIVSLEAKVQDADESEEALRLTLKAAAHAKEELLAGAREKAKVTLAEADERAADVVAAAEKRARALTEESESRAIQVTGDAEAHAAALTAGATEQAREVARAALAESELLVERIEQLRRQLDVAEEALQAISVGADPQLRSARSALETALEQSRASAENPELLAAAAARVATPVAVAPMPTEATPLPERVADEDPVGEEDAEMTRESAAWGEPQDQPHHESQGAVEDEVETERSGSFEEPAMPDPYQPEDDAEGFHKSVENQASEEDQHVSAPQLEVVESAEQVSRGESTADISDKVDRLLEELREVT